MDDPALIRRAQSGDAAGFAELVDLHYDTIYRFAWRWCGHTANAEDIAQLACIKLAASLTQYRFQSAFTSWLYRLVVTCALDWQRAQQRAPGDCGGSVLEKTPAGHCRPSLWLLGIIHGRLVWLKFEPVRRPAGSAIHATASRLGRRRLEATGRCCPRFPRAV